jgi:hypothetical protein
MQEDTQPICKYTMHDALHVYVITMYVANPIDRPYSKNGQGFGLKFHEPNVSFVIEPVGSRASAAIRHLRQS